MQRSKSYALMFLLGAFIAGGALGFTADRVVSRDKPNHRGGGRLSMGRMAKALDLTPAQRVQFDSIMSNRRRQMHEQFKPFQPQMDSMERIGKTLSDSTHEQMKRILTPAQQVKLDAMRAKGLRESAEKRARWNAGRDRTNQKP